MKKKPYQTFLQTFFAPEYFCLVLERLGVSPVSPKELTLFKSSQKSLQCLHLKDPLLRSKAVAEKVGQLVHLHHNNVSSKPTLSRLQRENRSCNPQRLVVDMLLHSLIRCSFQLQQNIVFRTEVLQLVLGCLAKENEFRDGSRDGLGVWRESFALRPRPRGMMEHFGPDHESWSAWHMMHGLLLDRKTFVGGAGHFGPAETRAQLSLFLRGLWRVPNSPVSGKPESLEDPPEDTDVDRPDKLKFPEYSGETGDHLCQIESLSLAGGGNSNNGRVVHAYLRALESFYKEQIAPALQDSHVQQDKLVPQPYHNFLAVVELYLRFFRIFSAIHLPGVSFYFPI